jgi:hypothetical protein
MTVRHFSLSFTLVWMLSVGCTAPQLTAVELTRKFNGKIGNLAGDGKVAIINSECRGFGSGQTQDGMHYAQFDLAPRTPNNIATKFQVFCVFPEILRGQILVTNTEPGNLVVWLFKEDPDYSNTILIERNAQKEVLGRGGIKMAGRVAVKWNSDADFVIGVDLKCPGDEATWLQGEFVASKQRELNPILYEWPAVLLFQQAK